MKPLSSRFPFLVVFLALAAQPLFTACSSGPEVKRQKYAVLRDERTFEYEFPFVWRAIEKAMDGYKIDERDPEDVTPVELKNLTERSIKTDWIYGKSRDKYIEYTVNDFPRKKYLQTRIRFTVRAESVIGGTKVLVESLEEIERLGPDGTSAGYEQSGVIDSSRANEILEAVRMALLRADP